MSEASIRLGLIGAGISKSSAPRLHRFLGAAQGLSLRYDLIDSLEAAAFDLQATLRRCADSGYRGVNVTHPFKQAAAAGVTVADPAQARLGAVNCIRFESDGRRGANSDYSGFKRAYRAIFRDAPPGVVTIAGAGGVGRAVAFALAELGAAEIRLFDHDLGRAAALAEALADAGATSVALSPEDLVAATRSAAGLVNCTPLGMERYPGMAFEAAAIGGQRWAFDAVYTPLETEFLAAAEAAGLAAMTGYELFLYQGLDAFEFFTGLRPDPALALKSFLP